MAATDTITLASGDSIEIGLATAVEIRGAMNRALNLFSATAHIPRGNVKAAHEVAKLVQLKPWLMDQVPHDVWGMVQNVIKHGKPIVFQ